METDIDNNKSDNRANEFEQQLRMETRAANSNKTDIYLNAYEPSPQNHEYKNLNQHDLNQFHENRIGGSDHLNHNNQMEMNPYEDDVQTVHSEGIRSEMESTMPPPLHKRPHNQNQPSQDEDDMTKDIENEICTLTLGDISEADDRVKKFYGIIPKDNNKEIKTVRMVKRDSKERSTSALGNGLASGGNMGNKFYDEISENDAQNMLNENGSVGDQVFQNGPPPPPPLPRGNYGQNLHNFLTTQQPNSKEELQNGFNPNMDNIIDLTSTSKSACDKSNDKSGERKYRGQIMNGEEANNLNMNQTSASTNGASGVPKTNFVLGEYQRRKSKVIKHLNISRVCYTVEILEILAIMLSRNYIVFRRTVSRGLVVL